MWQNLLNLVTLVLMVQSKVASTYLPTTIMSTAHKGKKNTLRNLNVKNGLCNGTRLQVMEMGKNLITAKILTGNNEGSIATIPRIKL